MNTTDTNDAVSTPTGTGGIGVIRISGPEAFDVCGRLFSRDVKSMAANTCAFGKITAEDGSVLDEVVVTVFRAPHSYTGDDTAEISCHGGMAVTRAVLERVLECGARMAEGGEFTYRAFLAGKMDLAEAEAVNDLIKARTEAAAKIALSQMEGSLSRALLPVRDALTGILARIEACIDFPEDVPEPPREELRTEIETALKSLTDLAATFDGARLYREGLRVVITGRVNTGKSSLLNALLRSDRAIVTDIEGTTRDVIEESFTVKGLPVVAVDTAGLRETEDKVERMGIDLTRKALEKADIILFVLDGSREVAPEEREEIESLRDKKVILAVNKIDLNPAAEGDFDLPAVRLSAETGEGVEDLRNMIFDLAGAAEIAPGSAAVANLRHKNALKGAAESLENASETLRSDVPLDLISADVREALLQTGLILGDACGEDLLERIFSDFCIGK